MKRIIGKTKQYWQDPYFNIKSNPVKFSTIKLTFTAILCSLATIFQSAGGYLPGIGYLLSTMATLPIFLATIVSIRQGIFCYFVTFFLLIIIQPSELIIFSFTTGIFGLILGFSINKFKKRYWVVLLSGATLSIGIIAIILFFQFPVLGPGIGTSLDFPLLILLAMFSIIYAWIAAEACSFALKRLVRTTPDRIMKLLAEIRLEDDSS